MLDPLLKTCFAQLLKMGWILIAHRAIYVKNEDLTPFLYDNLADGFSINHVKKFRVTDFFFGLRLLMEKIGENNYYQWDNNP
jgi:hypothetical protein